MRASEVEGLIASMVEGQVIQSEAGARITCMGPHWLVREHDELSGMFSGVELKRSARTAAKAFTAIHNRNVRQSAA